MCKQNIFYKSNYKSIFGKILYAVGTILKYILKKNKIVGVYKMC